MKYRMMVTVNLEAENLNSAKDLFGKSLRRGAYYLSNSEPEQETIAISHDETNTVMTIEPKGN